MLKGTNFFKSIQWKLVVIYALLILVAMQVIGVYFVRSLEKQYITNFSKSVEDRAGLVAYNVGKEFDKTGDDEASKRQLSQSLGQLLSEFSNGSTSRNDILEVQIIDQDSIIQATSDDENQSAVGQRATNSLIKKHRQRARPGRTPCLIRNQRIRSGSLPYRLPRNETA